MDVLHLQGNIPGDEIAQTEWFNEANLKGSLEFGSIQKVTLSMGVQNLLNAYQDDFDVGLYRDSNYVYGPARPRTVYTSVAVTH